MTKLAPTLIAFATLLICGCNDGKRPVAVDNNNEPDQGDASAPDAVSTDDVTADISNDADASVSDCTQVSVSDVFFVEHDDDVSIEYGTALTPAIAGAMRTLELLFERYNDTLYEGTFELGIGPDANFGTCAHCLYIRGDNPERAFFTDRGTLTLAQDPYTRKLDVTVTNLRLVAVGVDPFTRESAVIPDGECIEVADFSHRESFPVDGWTCAPEAYGDGETCNCNCGAYDTDCGGPVECLPGGPPCTPRDALPAADCAAEELCVFEPISTGTQCTATCDWVARTPCAMGTCAFDFGVDADLCLTDARRFAPTVGIGEDCPPNGLQLLCNVVGGFAEGYCDPNNVCRPICMTDDECPEPDQTCRHFRIPGTLGYCGPEPTDG